VLKVKVKVKGHAIRALLSILEMSYSVIDGLVINFQGCFVSTSGEQNLLFVVFFDYFFHV